MYKFNKDFSLDGITKEDVQDADKQIADNSTKIKIQNYEVTLNPFVQKNFSAFTGRPFFTVLNSLLTEATLHELVKIAERTCHETVLELNDTTVSGIINFLMTEILEKLSENPGYNGKYINLFK